MIEARPSPRQRDARLDVLRALFIVSMAFSHLALNSSISNAMHPFVWIDGAFGFVFFSGIALSLSRYRQVTTGHSVDAHRWVARRAVTLWAVACGLSLAALVLKAVSDSPRFMWPRVDQASDLIRAVPGVLTLSTQPDYLDILPTYVALMLLAQPALWLLRRGWSAAVLAGSLVLYAFAEHGTLDDAPDVGNAMRWPSWQLLFLGGMVVGWHWPAVTGYLHRRGLAITTAATLLAVAVLLAAHGRLPALARSFDKNALSPTTVVAGLAVLVVAFQLVGALLGTPLRRGLTLGATLGRHSLGCFITLTIIQIGELTVGHPRNLLGSMHVAVAAGGVAACAVVSWLGDRSRRPHLATPVGMKTAPTQTAL